MIFVSKSRPAENPRNSCEFSHNNNYSRVRSPGRVDAGAEGDVGAVVVRDDALGVVPQELGGWRGILLRVPVDVRSRVRGSNRLGGLLLAPRLRALDRLSFTRASSAIFEQWSNRGFGGPIAVGERRAPLALAQANRAACL